MHQELPIFQDPDARRALEEACRRHGVTVELLRDLANVQRANLGKAKQIGITPEFEAFITEFIDTQGRA